MRGGSLGFGQVWVYEDADDDSAPNLYVHHNIIVPAFPLSVAWMDCNLQETSSLGNLAAVRVLPTPWTSLPPLSGPSGTEQSLPW